MRNIKLSKLNELLSLTEEKDTAAIKRILNSEPADTKGHLFEHYLAELYKGNGWLAVVQGGRNDAGADILLYHPSTPNKVSVIIQAKNHKQKLDFDDTKIELVKFEDQASYIYDCNQYCLFTLNGYVERALKLSNFNMSLYGWDEITNLIGNYNPKCEKPYLELHAHNHSTYKKVISLFLTQQRVSCVQATGTGKSYLIAQCLLDNYPLNCLVLAPSHYILKQQNQILPTINDNVKYMTYALAANKPKKFWKSLNPALIVIDEFHRAGAKQWEQGVKNILDACPQAKIFGTSATHIRYLDNARNMADELFEGTIANETSLQDAIARQILPEPYYVSALYTIKDEIQSITDDILNCDRTEEEKKQALKELDKSRIDWETSSGIPNILHKHLSVIPGKYIVFCENIKHMDAMQDDVSAWFRKAAALHSNKILKRQRYIVSSSQKNTDNDAVIKSFENANSDDSIHLLFAVNMLNEGLHLTGVKGVILLRKTVSPIIYFQQIGRCFNVSGGIKPIIFDLVNNLRNINAASFKETLDEAIEKENVRRREVGLDDKLVAYRISDETGDIVKQLNTLEKRLGLDLNDFEVGLTYLAEYKEIHGNCLVEKRFITDNGFNLGTWISYQRTNYKNSTLLQYRINQLESLGFIWDTKDFNFQQGISELTQHKNEHGHCRVKVSYVSESGFNLGRWLSSRRMEYKNKNFFLTPQRTKVLEALGVEWDPLESVFQQGLEEVAKFKKNTGHCRINADYKTSDGFFLGKWVSHRRQDYKLKINSLTDERIKLLEKLGFEWDPSESDFQFGLSALKKFTNENGHARVPDKYTDKTGFFLGGWVGRRRKEFREKKEHLTKKRISQLDDIGFLWDLVDSDFSVGIRALENYVKIFGDSRVPSKYITDTGFTLGNWINSRRNEFRNKTASLTKEYVDNLNYLGFEWDPYESDFKTGYLALLSYKKEHGDCLVSQKFICENGFKLGNWVSNRRKGYREKSSYMIQERIDKLDKINFDWDPFDTQFKAGLDALRSFKEQTGDLDVPWNYVTENSFKLGAWISNKKRDFKVHKKTLTPSRILQLKDLGFKFD